MPLTLRMDPGNEGGSRADAGEPPRSAKPDANGEAEETVTQVQPPASSKRVPKARRCPTCDQAFSGEARFCPFDGDLLKETDDWNPSADPLIGETIDGRYEVVGVIGEGGMGTVYEVRHKTLGRRFALKVLRRDIADAEHTARFIREAKAAAAIGHPHIVAVSDFGEVRLNGPTSPAVPYFVMEYLTGISLARLLRAEKTLTAQRAGALVQQCASGLAAAHAAGVIHRDLKPDNVFLTRNGDREFVKLLDFGVAKMAGAGRLTRQGMVFGTPHYMSPEQAAGQNVDHRADIYALGVILYECFAGKVPFEADTYMGVLTKHMFATPEPIERICPDPSKLGALAPIIMRCLAKNPEDRYPSMAEFSAALDLALTDPGRAAGAALSERPPGSAGASLRLGKGERFEGRVEIPKEEPPRPMGTRLAIGLAAIVVLLVGAMIWMSVHKSGAGPEVKPTTPDQHASTAIAPTASPPATSEPTSATTAAATAPASTATDTPSGNTPPAATSATTPIKSGTAPVRSNDPAHPKGPKRPGGGGDVVDPWGH